MLGDFSFQVDFLLGVERLFVGWVAGFLLWVLNFYELVSVRVGKFINKLCVGCYVRLGEGSLLGGFLL